MNQSVAQNQSDKDFEMIAKPILEDLLRCKVVKTNQCADEHFATDRYCYLNSGKRLSLQVRVQWDMNWRTWTVRLGRETGTRTEYEKVVDAMEKGDPYPVLWLQMYVKDDQLLSLGVARTADIFKCIELGLFMDRHTGKDQIGQADLRCVWWSELMKRFPAFIIDCGTALDLGAIKYIRETDED